MLYKHMMVCSPLLPHDSQLTGSIRYAGKPAHDSGWLADHMHRNCDPQMLGSHGRAHLLTCANGVIIYKADSMQCAAENKGKGGCTPGLGSCTFAG